MIEIEHWFYIILGIILWNILYFITYKCFWFSFKLKGKRHNLKVIKCKECKNRFYAWQFETTDLCNNCICLQESQE